MLFSKTSFKTRKRVGINLIFFLTISFSFPISAQNKWLYFSNEGNLCPSYINIGDLDISGDQLTIEAKIITEPEGATCYHTPYSNTFDIVSKHYNREDVNYLLRANYCQITTTTGFFTTSARVIDFNKCHHVAMVYNGSFLKFYYDGCLYDSVPATGQLITNNWETKIGFYASLPPGRSEQFFGYIDEVRFWNIARTEQQIKGNANRELQNNDTTGLIAYYNFNNGYQNIHNNIFNGNPTGNPVLALNDNNVAPTPAGIAIAGNKNICQGETTTFTAIDGKDYYWYTENWSSTGNKITVSPSVTTTYYVKEITTSKCYSSDSILLNVLSTPNIKIEGDTLVCSGDLVSLSASGAESYTWSATNFSSNSATINIYPEKTTIYYLNGKNSNNCETTVEQKVTVLNSAKADFDFSFDECNEEIIFRNLSTGALSYEWDFDDGNISNEIHPIHHYLKSGNYKVSLTINKNSHCENTFSKQVDYNFKIYIPNIFTPNHDDFNDKFEIIGLKECLGSSIIIYNRWGKKVFSSNEPSKEFWDGTYEGKEIASGCYYYYIKNKEKEYQGTVRLLR